jgi:hypothetical protein
MPLPGPEHDEPISRLPDERRPAGSDAESKAAADETRSAVVVGSAVETSDAAQVPGDGGAAWPDHLGRYRLLRRIGAGGMGAVFEADDPALRRKVAIKVPHFSGSADRQAVSRQRFLREARSAAAVEHVHVCPIHDVGEDGGQPFVVMAFIDGESLAGRLLRPPALTARKAAALMVKIATGLGAVHAHGILHRDLKPANILIRGQDGEPVLTDFGLARVADEDENLTAAGAILGTPAYMAPEQADPSLGPVTAQSDLFSLGVILFEMITGRRPFEGSALQIISQVSSRPVPRASAIRGDVDPALDAIIARATARNAGDRFADAGEFAGALSDWLGGVPAPATTVDYVAFTARAAAARRRRRAGALGAACAALLVCLGIYLHNKDKPDGQTSVTTKGTGSIPPGPDSPSGGTLTSRCGGRTRWWAGSAVRK